MGVAVSLYDAGELDAAINSYRRALELFERVEDRSFELSVLHSIATIHFERGAIAEARELAERSLALAKMSGDTRVEAAAQVILARILLSDGEAEASLDLARTAEKALTNDRVQHADALRVMGAAHDALGAHAASDKAYRKSIELLTEIDDRPDRSAIAAEYSKKLRARGDVDAAFHYLELARGR